MIVFPMSGLSSRFSKAGYLSNKYKLDLYGHSVFHHIISQFKHANLNDCFVFIHNGNEFDENFIKQACHDMGLQTEKYSIVKLIGETRGQAETVAKGLEQISINSDERLVIYNIDSIRIGFDLPEELDTLDVDGYLEVFQGEGDHWSFALPKDENSDKSFLEVAKVAEKERISTYCSNGLYYFKSLKIFKYAYESELKRFDGKSELFVAPLYNNIIKTNKSVYMREIPAKATVFCGTPQEYETILSLPIPDGLIPSKEYVADKITSYATGGVSQKNYYGMMDMLSYVVNITNLEKSSNILNALNIFYSHYSSYVRSINYSFSHAKSFGETKRFLEVYEFLKSRLTKLFKHTFYVQRNSPKALNLACILILIGDKNFIPQHQNEFQELLHLIRITEHQTLFKVVRNNKIDGLDFLENCFSINNKNESISYLFTIFCAAYNHENNTKYFSYIQEKLATSYECENDDTIRKTILTKFFLENDDYNSAIPNEDFVKPVGLINNTKNLVLKNIFSEVPKVRNNDIVSFRDNPVRVAVLITGQIRNCSYMANFFKTINIPGIEFDLYLSTWNDIGSAPPHLNSLRGYDSKIKTAIKNRASKYGVSNHEFSKTYSLKKDIDVDSASLGELFGNFKWLNIDEEGETTEYFNSNQERMFYQVSKAYNQAKNKGYDVYIRTRPDLSFNLKLEALENLILDCSQKERLIYVKNNPLNHIHLPFVDDNFAICSPQAMETYASLFDILKDDKVTGIPLFNEGKSIRHHSSLAYNLLLNNIKIDFIEALSGWKFNDIGEITAFEYIEYLKTLDKEDLNTSFIKSVISKLRTIK